MESNQIKINLSNEVLKLIEMGYGKYDGNDNHGKPKHEFLQKLINSSDGQLKDECERYIWLSAYASNNYRSDYHFMCDACYDECNRRGKKNNYVSLLEALKECSPLVDGLINRTPSGTKRNELTDINIKVKSAILEAEQ